MVGDGRAETGRDSLQILNALRTISSQQGVGAMKDLTFFSLTTVHFRIILYTGLFINGEFYELSELTSVAIGLISKIRR